MNDFIANIYDLLFVPSTTQYNLWYNQGYIFGFIIVLALPFLSTLIYYKLLGRKRNHANLRSWIITLFFTIVFIYLFSVSIIGFKVFYATKLSEIKSDVYIFAFWNLCIGVFVYFISSLIIKRWGRNNSRVPF